MDKNVDRFEALSEGTNFFFDKKMILKKASHNTAQVIHCDTGEYVSGDVVKMSPGVLCTRVYGVDWSPQ